MGRCQKEQGSKRHGRGACLSQTMVRCHVTLVISQWMSCVTKKSRHRTMPVYAVRGIQGRGDNGGSKKDALLTSPTRPRNALHFRRSGMGRPPKREGREEKMRDEVAPPHPEQNQETNKVGSGSLGGKAERTMKQKSREFSAERQMETVDPPEGVSRKRSAKRSGSI